MEKNNSFFDFEKTSKSEWIQKIEKDLKGKPLSILEKQLEENVNVNAVYGEEDLPDNLFEIYKKSSGWNFAESFSKEASNADVLAALARGINELNIPFSNSFIRQIQGVETSFINLNLVIETAKDLEDLKSEETIESLHNLRIINDPLNRAIKTGEKIDLSSYGSWNLSSGICVDLLHLQNAGASVVQQMAAFLGTLSEYVSIVGSSKLQNTYLRVGVSKNYFLEIAKLRALRLVFETFCEAHDAEGSLKISAETSLSDYARLDSKTNILRATTQAASAIIGGADAVAISPFEAMNVEQSELSKRVARNIHHLLKEESHLDVVNDPSKGSYYVENLTNELAQKAWAKFVEIDKSGGYASALKDGWFQHEVMGTASQMQELFKNSSKTIIGVNKYPNTLEKAAKIQSKKLDDELTETIVLDAVNFALPIELEKQNNNE